MVICTTPPTEIDPREALLYVLAHTINDAAISDSEFSPFGLASDILDMIEDELTGFHDGVATYRD